MRCNYFYYFYGLMKCNHTWRIRIQFEVSLPIFIMSGFKLNKYVGYLFVASSYSLILILYVV